MIHLSLNYFLLFNLTWALSTLGQHSPNRALSLALGAHLKPNISSWTQTAFLFMPQVELWGEIRPKQFYNCLEKSIGFEIDSESSSVETITAVMTGMEVLSGRVKTDSLNARSCPAPVLLGNAVSEV